MNYFQVKSTSQQLIAIYHCKHGLILVFLFHFKKQLLDGNGLVTKLENWSYSVLAIYLYGGFSSILSWSHVEESP